MSGIDYRKLLWKYMEHVSAMEGVDFVSDIRLPPWHKDDITKEELVELQNIRDMGSDYVD